MKLIGVYDYTVILTYLSLLSAFAGTLLASRGAYTAAVLCLVFSGICDAFDGTVARSKKNRTEEEKAFGIQIDSLCDAVSFGLFPALLCYFLGMKGWLGVAILALYSLCGIIRLAFFNVIEGKRQQTEGGANKTYRGLPITSSSMILPLTYLLKFILSKDLFLTVLHIVMAATGFLFVLDFSMKKPDWSRLLRAK